MVVNAEPLEAMVVPPATTVIAPLTVKGEVLLFSLMAVMLVMGPLRVGVPLPLPELMI
jgi:hypothetical protein